MNLKYISCSRARTIKIIGESCGSNYECWSENCFAGVCKAKELPILIDIGETCVTNDECLSDYCSGGICKVQIAKATGESCSTNDECDSNKCSSGTCLKHHSCEVLGGFEGSFDEETIVIVFIGAGFTDMEQWDRVATEHYKALSKVEMFSDENAKYKALYVREPSEQFCYYWCNGIERLLCCEEDSAFVIADKCFQKQETMQTVVIVNNDKYASDKERANDILILITGGFDTTAITFTFTLLELAKNELEQTKLRKELRNMHPDKRIESIGLKNVIKESMRLRPLFPILSREVKHDFVVKRTETNSLLEMDMLIPKGSMVILPLFLLCWNSDIFIEPHKFIPSRWTEPTEQQLAAVMPYGLGRRTCIGQSLAKAELLNGLAKICAEYRFTVDDEGIIGHDVFLRPEGVKLFVFDD